MSITNFTNFIVPNPQRNPTPIFRPGQSIVPNGPAFQGDKTGQISDKTRHQADNDRTI